MAKGRIQYRRRGRTKNPRSWRWYKWWASAHGQPGWYYFVYKVGKTSPTREANWIVKGKA